MDIDFGTILINLLFAVLTAAVPILLRYLLGYLSELARKAKAEVGERNYYLLSELARGVVKSAEQAIDGAGIDKKRYATNVLRSLANEAGIEPTDEQIHNLIEAAVFELKQWSEPATLTVSD